MEAVSREQAFSLLTLVIKGLSVSSKYSVHKFLHVWKNQKIPTKKLSAPFKHREIFNRAVALPFRKTTYVTVLL